MTATLNLGWDAPPIAKQFPALSVDDAAHFETDRQAIMRLYARGYLNDAQHDAVSKKLAKQVGAAATAAHRNGPKP